MSGDSTAEFFKNFLLALLLCFGAAVAIGLGIRFSLWRDKQKEESRKYEIHPR
jgi:hypothetical protein